MSELDQIRQSIEARIAELQTEITALEAARSALRGNSTSRRTRGRSSTTPVAAAPRRRTARTVGADGRSGGGAPQTTNGAGADVAPPAALAEAPTNTAAKPRARTPSRRSRRSANAADVLLGGKLEAMLGEAEDGLSAVTISKRADAGYNTVLAFLRKLESAGQVRRTGARRTSLWRLITEEERIAARAEELAKLAASTAS